ncbi:hypothetical protein llap_13801 [Limosa lapponica baueri]|uniref:Uncharacterized protein n=1 Tax=Limosa lapponica baueri TaxID=1758121 RepID=A0A2I0TQ47_LIMLA|nr:hypothetical protein llap_13801 [Limosa lapponica baueri]
MPAKHHFIKQNTWINRIIILDRDRVKLQAVEVPLDGSTILWFCVICRFAEGTLCPIIQIMMEILNTSGSSIGPWRTLLDLQLDFIPLITTLAI